MAIGVLNGEARRVRRRRGGVIDRLDNGTPELPDRVRQLGGVVDGVEVLDALRRAPDALHLNAALFGV